MNATWQWLLRRLLRQLWFRATVLSLLAVVAALIALVLAPYIPADLPAKIGSDAVDGILEILASSLLAVTIFSLSTAVYALGNATRNVTPRAAALLLEDATTQNVLATFLGAFLYSLVGIITLATGAYGSQGRVVLFVVTLLLIVLIVVTLLRWISHLSSLGTVSETTDRVESATSKALEARIADPHLGGSPLKDPAAGIPAGAREVCAAAIGYVQHVDTGALSECAEKHGGRVFVVALPGAFVYPSQPVAKVLDLPSQSDEAVRAAFTIGKERSFDQDPRFGLAVLAEIASRALSPAMNDPGTAIDVIGRASRVLAACARAGTAERDKPPFRQVLVPALRIGDLFDDVFNAIARDGAAIFEVQIRLQKALQMLARIDARLAKDAARHALLALERAEAAPLLAEERERLRAAAQVTQAIAQ
jgi:uncharacterized membrane protein